jgi:hypothetical protein
MPDNGKYLRFMMRIGDSSDCALVSARSEVDWVRWGWRVARWCVMLLEVILIVLLVVHLPPKNNSFPAKSTSYHP